MDWIHVYVGIGVMSSILAAQNASKSGLDFVRALIGGVVVGATWPFWWFVGFYKMMREEQNINA